MYGKNAMFHGWSRLNFYKYFVLAILFYISAILNAERLFAGMWHGCQVNGEKSTVAVF